MAPPQDSDAVPLSESNTLLTRFKFSHLLNTDQAGRRIILQGTISSQPALLLVERAAFSIDTKHLTSLNILLSHVQNLGANDVYRWYLANSLPENGVDEPTPPDLKVNLIWPASEKHVRKYTFQQVRMVRESGEVYAKYVRKYMRQCREELGRLDWVWNILDGKAEQEDVLFRSPGWGEGKGEGFLLLPDLNWDRKTVGSMHLLALVERRDLWSVRDLKKRDVAWLKGLRGTLAKTAKGMFPKGEVEEDMLKFYVHYQPTYYHFHVHVVHVNLDAGATQAVGKALGLDAVIAWLESMGGGEEVGMDGVEMSYTVGEQSELWQKIFKPLKEGKEPEVDG